MSAGTYDVCVIGSGAGGLGAAVLLAKSGVKTLMLERHWQVGGCITSFKRKGFSFDPGASMFSKKMTTMVLDMVGMTQRVDLTLIPVKSPGLRFHSAKADIRLSEGMNTSEVVAQFPDLKTKQSSAVERVIDEAVSVASLENAPPMSLLQWLQDNSIDPAISIVIYMPSYFLLVQPPSNSPVRIGSSIASLASFDLCYPRGGVVEIAKAYVQAFTILGGELRTKTAASRIMVKDGKVEGVELDGGEKILCKAVVSDAGLGNTVKLVGENNIKKDVVNRVRHMKSTLSCFTVFLGLDFIPDIVPHTFSIGAADIYEIERVYSKFDEGKFFESENDPIPMYVHTSSLEDPGMAPPGHSSMNILVWAPYDLSEGNWKEKKEHYASITIRAAEERLIPGLSKHIVYRETATPLTYERFLGKDKGPILGASPGIDQVPLSGDVLSIKGLYCVGDTVAGGLAVPGAFITGVGCAQKIMSSL